ncbi:autophagy-related protein [Suillus bovinus]|uniref:autophagy-related protein n=1 Tax=Suillus bovinus TaxID=48563 RepID=UPI001B866752|nr:autophagy-related protein [Suillus bovinus]KAG2144659.1 autophagy-related protein [Suillus bovinus]
MNANFPTVTIDVILDRHSAKEVLTAILHSILFHRLFGTVKPQTFEVLDVTMSSLQPGVSDPEMEHLVTEKVDIFWKGIESGANKRGQIIVTFSEKRAKKSWFQVYVGEEEVPWEQWIVNVEMRQPKSEDRQEFNANIASALFKALNVMLTHTSSERGRTAVPLITNATGISPFPIKIVVKVGGVEIG